MLANWIFYFLVYLVVELWFKQTLFVMYYTIIYSVILNYFTMIKGDTLWQLIYCDKIWYILWLYRDLSRHTVYENQQILIQFFCTILTVKKADAYVSLFTLLMHCTIFLRKVKEGDTLCYIFHKYWISYVTLFDKWK